MRISEVTSFQSAGEAYDKGWSSFFLFTLETALLTMARSINGGLGFGDGIDTDNMMGKWVTFTTNVTPGTEDEITHDLGVIPCGFLVFIPPVAGIVNNGTTPWTTSKLYLTCTAASQSVRIFVVIPSHGQQA